MSREETSNDKASRKQNYETKKMSTSEQSKKKKEKIFHGGLSCYLFK